MQPITGLPFSPRSMYPDARMPPAMLSAVALDRTHFDVYDGDGSGAGAVNRSGRWTVSVRVAGTDGEISAWQPNPCTSRCSRPIRHEHAGGNRTGHHDHRPGRLAHGLTHQSLSRGRLPSRPRSKRTTNTVTSNKHGIRPKFSFSQPIMGSVNESR
jgi:hypothetical protein